MNRSLSISLSPFDLFNWCIISLVFVFNISFRVCSFSFFKKNLREIHIGFRSRSALYHNDSSVTLLSSMNFLPFRVKFPSGFLLSFLYSFSLVWVSFSSFVFILNATFGRIIHFIFFQLSILFFSINLYCLSITLRTITLEKVR